MARTSLSGIPEWLPEGRIIEMHVLDELRRVFELHGFAGIETRAVETLEQLEAKGETSKEIYVLDRLQALKAAASGGRAPKDKGMGLHFDLTVPFARYVVENANELASRSSAIRSRRCGAASVLRTVASVNSRRRILTSWATESCPSTLRSICRS